LDLGSSFLIIAFDLQDKFSGRGVAAARCMRKEDCPSLMARRARL